MTTTTLCLNCGVRMVGVVKQCPKCGGERLAVDQVQGVVEAYAAWIDAAGPDRPALRCGDVAVRDPNKTKREGLE